MWCVTSVVEYFDWLKKPVKQVPSTEGTIIYSKFFVSCSCHSFPKPVKNPVLYCTITLCICTVAMHYLDVTKDSWIINDKATLSGLPRSGKNFLFFKVREKSGNFTSSQGNSKFLVKVSEK